MTDAHSDYVHGASERYRRAHEAIAAAIDRVFGGAEVVMQWDMPMWLIPRPPHAPKPDVEGTVDAHYVHIGLVERKAGLTLHLWYPPEYEFLGDHEDELKDVGLKVMKGCVQFNRKGEFPVEAVEPLLDEIRRKDGF